MRLAGETSLSERLARPVDVASLATFRFLFGALMVWEVVRYFSHDYISQFYIQPRFHFTYEFFPFVAPLPGNWMYGLFLAMGLFALGVAVGFYYRLSALLFFLAYSYVFLIDKAQYNNHYYLIVLLSFLLTLTHAQRWASVDKLRKVKFAPETIPFWQLFILRAQIFIVYFYAGIAKLNQDWLTGEPLRSWLAERADYPFLGPFFTTEGATYFFSYGGLFFDLSIGFLLLWPRTRLVAFVGLLFFHLMNSWLFPIGIFPYLALATMILFVEPDWPRCLLQRWRGLGSHPAPLVFEPVPAAKLNPWTFGFVGLYLTFQLLFPLRHWLYPGPVSWTEEGHRFAWHMRLRDKDTRLEFYLKDPTIGQSWQVDLSADLTPWQIERMAGRPDMILQYAHSLKTKLHQAGLDQIIITANIWTSLNGRPYQHLIDPNVNLAQVDYPLFGHASWILPLTEKQSSESLPVLYGLSIFTTLLIDLGLALSIYFVIDYYRKHRNEFTNPVTHRLYQNPILVQPLLMSQAQMAGLIKVISGTLLYLVILFSLATWIMTGQLAWLNLAFIIAIAAAAWGFYLASLLPAQSSHSRVFFWIPSWLGIGTSLFLLMMMIIVG